MARKLANKGLNDTNKAVNKARRLATKAFDFEEEDESTSLNSADYDLLLSAAGATELTIPAHGQVTKVKHFQHFQFFQFFQFFSTFSVFSIIHFVFFF
jgi:hypothetical protein